MNLLLPASRRIMRGIPEMTVLEPTDTVMLADIIRQISGVYGMHYMRLVRKQSIIHRSHLAELILYTDHFHWYLNGGTHMPFEDMGIMRGIPEMTVLEPTDTVSHQICVENNDILILFRQFHQRIAEHFPHFHRTSVRSPASTACII